LWLDVANVTVEKFPFLVGLAVRLRMKRVEQ